MKWNRNSFGTKLWLYFAAFAAVIFILLWLLQIVFLQSFYNAMTVRNVEKASDQIADTWTGADIGDTVDELAYNNSLLIFITDDDGNILYSADEHSAAYQEKRTWNHQDGDGNPYRDQNELMNWQLAAFRNLPEGYEVLVQKLADSDTGTVGYAAENNDAYVYGRKLAGGAILYISTPLGAVSATVRILRVQLVWVTFFSLALALVIACFLSRRFARPVMAITAQAGRLAERQFEGEAAKGFCLELDSLSDTLESAAAELARSENYRRELLSGVSHDLRTPLTMIKGYAEALRDFSWEDEEKRESDLLVIIREANRLTGLVNEILEYSVLQAKEQPRVFQEINLSGIALHVIRQFSPQCERDGVAIDADIAPNLAAKGNEAQIERVLYNLIDNAIRHAGNGRRVRVTLRDTGSDVRAEVRDFGGGIPPEELSHVWERYFTARQRGQSVSGLGLAIVKEILTAHGARFGVESTIGKGSVFWFEMRK